MKVYRKFTDINIKQNAVITIGTFDGIHMGHRDILNQIKSIADSEDLKSFVITFDPHPRAVVSKNYNISLLSTLEEKIEIMKEVGIDNLFIMNFTMDIAGLTAEEFLKKLIESNINIKHIVLGYDHKFGKNRSGDEETVREIGKVLKFDVTTVNAVKLDDNEISSTKIRHAIESGHIREANKMLGSEYSFSGKVVRGARRGREMGFPTANIELFEKEKLVPKKGVYFVRSTVKGETYFAVMNIGMRPTFNDVIDLVIEAHIFDFNQDIYDEKIKVEFLERIRDEQKFNSTEELIHQIEADKKKGYQIRSKYITN